MLMLKIATPFLAVQLQHTPAFGLKLHAPSRGWAPIVRNLPVEVSEEVPLLPVSQVPVSQTLVGQYGTTKFLKVSIRSSLSSVPDAYQIGTKVQLKNAVWFAAGENEGLDMIENVLKVVLDPRATNNPSPTVQLENKLSEIENEKGNSIELPGGRTKLTQTIRGIDSSDSSNEDLVLCSYKYTTPQPELVDINKDYFDPSNLLFFSRETSVRYALVERQYLKRLYLSGRDFEWVTNVGSSIQSTSSYKFFKTFVPFRLS